MSEVPSLPIELWDEVVRHCDASSWRNLCQTCQPLYQRYRDILFDPVNDISGPAYERKFKRYGIVVTDDLEITSVNYTPSAPISSYITAPLVSSNQPIVKKYWFLSRVLIRSRKPLPNLYSILSQIVRCHISELIVESNNLTWNEYCLLTESKTVEVLMLIETKVTNSKNELVPLECIMSHIPNAYNIYLHPFAASLKTASRLLSLEHKTKIERLGLIEINGDMNGREFYIWCSKNLTEDAALFLDLSYKKPFCLRNFLFDMKFNHIASRTGWECNFQ